MLLLARTRLLPRRGATGPAFTSGGVITLTKGTAFGQTGYSDGTYVAAFGSISGEPIVGQNMQAFYQGDACALYFLGDITALLAGRTIAVSGYGTLAVASADEAASFNGTSTRVAWYVSGVFSGGGTQTIEFT